MFKNILLPTDGSPLSEQAAKKVTDLARTLNARVTGLYVTMPYNPIIAEPMVITYTYEDYERDAKAAADSYLSAIERMAAEGGIPFKRVTRSGVNTWREIINVAGEEGCDVIFMAYHGRRGIGALILGSECQKVLTHSKLLVIVFR